jgi:hypothetical protein
VVGGFVGLGLGIGRGEEERGRGEEVKRREGEGRRGCIALYGGSFASSRVRRAKKGMTAWRGGRAFFLYFISAW